MNNIRVRFAPSPTGALHIGGARTALFNWLFARSQGGSFILRVEDTDISRSTEESVSGIFDGLKWLGIDWNEGPDIGGNYGPYRQGERLEYYKKYLNQLLSEGKAYYCFCSNEEINKERQKAQQQKKDYKYKGTCRNYTPEQVREKLAQGLKPVIRLKTPEDGTTVVHDLIRGDVSFNNTLLDDFIIAKSDGWPTYNFAVVVDDYMMKISHVIRAEEHLSNTPKQILIYNALAFELPQFAHVSMILAPDRSKLSKRHGATSVQEFREDGFLPESLLNYLCLLGWSPGEDLDIMSINDIISRFKLEDVSKSAAIYDTKKLIWMNGHYIANANIDSIIKILENKAKQKGWLINENYNYFKQVVNLVRSRIKTLNEIFTACDYFFSNVQNYDEKGVKKYFIREDSVEKLEAVAGIINGMNGNFHAEDLETKIREQADLMGIKAAELIHPTRLALSGKTSTPGLFEIMELLGQETCISRIRNAITYIEAL